MLFFLFDTTRYALSYITHAYAAHHAFYKHTRTYRPDADSWGGSESNESDGGEDGEEDGDNGGQDGDSLAENYYADSGTQPLGTNALVKYRVAAALTRKVFNTVAANNIFMVKQTSV